MQTIFIFGNPDFEPDSLPVKLIPDLQKTYPDFSFVLKDPNEEWDVPENLTIIDTAIGLEKITVFDDLDSFVNAPRLSMHDFDALDNLRFLKKLGKLKNIKIIAVPPGMNKDEALKEIGRFLKKL